MADLRIIDYSTLKAAIADELNRGDLTDQIPVFIQLAEAMFNREVRWHKLTARDTDSAPAARVQLPDDFLELRLIQLNDDPVREPDEVTLQSLREYQNAHPVVEGTPLIYARDQDYIVFPWAPGVPLEIVSYVRLDMLGPTNDSNVLLDEHPDLYKYGALIQAETFLKNDGRLELWLAAYRAALASVNGANARFERPPGTQVQRMRRTF
jgi:hypothetical protein